MACACLSLGCLWSFGLYVVLSNGSAMFHMQQSEAVPDLWMEQCRDQKVSNGLSCSLWTKLSWNKILIICIICVKQRKISHKVNTAFTPVGMLMAFSLRFQLKFYFLNLWKNVFNWKRVFQTNGQMIRLFQRPNTRNLRIRSKAFASGTPLVFRPKCDLKKILLLLFLSVKIQITFIRNAQQLSCCFNLRGLCLLLWHNKIAWQQICKE